MPLTKLEKGRVIQLAKGVIEPENGMEKHFVAVCKGQGRACTSKEKEWFVYWQEYSSNNKSSQPLTEDISNKKEQIFIPNDNTKNNPVSSQTTGEQRYYTHYWDNSTWDNTAHLMQHAQEKKLNHSASNLFRERGVKSGDYVYIITVRGGSLYLGTRIFVEWLFDKKEAEEYFNCSDLWSAKDHIVTSDSQAMEFNSTRVVPTHIIEQLQILSPKGAVLSPIFSNSGKLDDKLFRGVKRLTEPSAKLLNSVLVDDIDSTCTREILPESEKGSPVSSLSEQIILIISILAKFAKADGVINREELNTIDNFMIYELKLDKNSRRSAIQVFKEAKEALKSFEEYAQQFHELFKDNNDKLVSTLGLLFTIAASNEIFHTQHEQLLWSAFKIFQFDSYLYEEMKNYFFPDKYYKTLECSPYDPDEVIKFQYRKLAHDYHPDKIVSKELAPAFITFATQKFQEIQEAYEVIKKIRGF